MVSTTNDLELLAPLPLWIVQRRHAFSPHAMQGPVAHLDPPAFKKTCYTSRKTASTNRCPDTIVYSNNIYIHSIFCTCLYHLISYIPKLVACTYPLLVNPVIRSIHPSTTSGWHAAVLRRCVFGGRGAPEGFAVGGSGQGSDSAGEELWASLGGCPADDQLAWSRISCSFFKSETNGRNLERLQRSKIRRGPDHVECQLLSASQLLPERVSCRYSPDMPPAGQFCSTYLTSTCVTRPFTQKHDIVRYCNIKKIQ